MTQSIYMYVCFHTNCLIKGSSSWQSEESRGGTPYSGHREINVCVLRGASLGYLSRCFTQEVHHESTLLYLAYLQE